MKQSIREIFKHSKSNFLHIFYMIDKNERATDLCKFYSGSCINKNLSKMTKLGLITRYKKGREKIIMYTIKGRLLFEKLEEIEILLEGE